MFHGTTPAFLTSWEISTRAAGARRHVSGSGHRCAQAGNRHPLCCCHGYAIPLIYMVLLFFMALARRLQ
jgi:hypothetical protein